MYYSEDSFKVHNLFRSGNDATLLPVGVGIADELVLYVLANMYLTLHSQRLYKHNDNNNIIIIIIIDTVLTITYYSVMIYLTSMPYSA